MRASFERSRDVFDKFVQMYGRLPTEVDPDYLELLRMSKYRIVDVPDVKPFKCGNCGSAKNDGRKYIDVGLDIDWYGTFFLDSLCLKDIAKEMGLFTEYEQIIEKLTGTNEDVDFLRERGISLEGTILRTFEEVKEYFADIHFTGSSPPPDISPDVVVDESSENPSESPTQRTDKPEPRTIKPDSSTRSTNLRSLADLLQED